MIDMAISQFSNKRTFQARYLKGSFINVFLLIFINHAVQITFQRSAHILLKISLAIFQTPFEYISDNNHTDIGADIL